MKLGFKAGKTYPPSLPRPQWRRRGEETTYQQIERDAGTRLF
jgi:hypothetical protein